jgi:methylmalonyl-CoA mutase C-terminal domain/subunit
LKNSARILIAKTGLDGHWRGASLVARALREAGFDVVMAGMSSWEEIVQAISDKEVDLLGISIGGHIEVAERAIAEARKIRPDLPVMVGGVVPPWAKKKLEAQGVEVYPPGSQMSEITEGAQRLTGYRAEPMPNPDTSGRT